MVEPSNRRLITEARLFDGATIKSDLLPSELGLSTPDVADIIADTAFIHEGITMTENPEEDAVIFTSVAAGAGPAVESFFTSVAASVTEVEILPINNGRKGATVYNDSSAIMNIALFDGASTTDFTTKIPPDGYFELPFEYQGVITAVWDSAVGNARVTEFE